MLRMFWNGKSAMMANQNKLDSISNNLANSETVGYKKVEVSFKDLVDETFERKGYPTENKDSYSNTGVKSTQWVRNNTQGNLKETGRKSDIALDGKGYFRLKTPAGGEVYTRDGAFSVDALGRMVDSRGNKLDLNFEPGYNENNVKFLHNNYSINQEGDVYIKQGQNFKKVAEIKVYDVVGTDSMISKGESLYVPKQGANMYVTKDANMLQGYVETSNVDKAEEFTEMILTQRAFEFGSKGIKAADEMWGMVNNLRSR